MREKKEDRQALPIADISRVEFSTVFHNWAADFHHKKSDYLNFLVTVQRLIIKDISENDYSEEYIEELEEYLLTVQNVILNA